MEHPKGGQGNWAPEILDQTGPALARVIDDQADDGRPPAVDGFRILDQIGVGGAASVWRAHDIGLDRVVAIKVLNVVPTIYTLARTDAPSRAIDQFREECRLLGAINDHPHVVSVHETGWTVNGQPFLVMAFCGGGSVKTRIRSTGPLRAEEILRIGVAIAGALAAAHGNDPMILHRDVKPENILFADGSVPVLADFGVAAVAVGGSAKTATITPSHVAPEVVCGEPHTVSSDVYSLASTLYEMAEGRSPFFTPRQPIDKLLDRIVNEPAQLPGEGVLPADVERLLMESLSKDPAARPANMTTFARRLQVAQERLGVVPSVFWAPWDVLPRRENPPSYPPSSPGLEHPLTDLEDPARIGAAGTGAVSALPGQVAHGLLGPNPVDQRWTEDAADYRPPESPPGARAVEPEPDRPRGTRRPKGGRTRPTATRSGAQTATHSATQPANQAANQPRTQRRLRSEPGPQTRRLRTGDGQSGAAPGAPARSGARTASSRPRRSEDDAQRGRGVVRPEPRRRLNGRALALIVLAVVIVVALWLLLTKVVLAGEPGASSAPMLVVASTPVREFTDLLSLS